MESRRYLTTNKMQQLAPGKLVCCCHISMLRIFQICLQVIYFDVVYFPAFCKLLILLVTADPIVTDKLRLVESRRYQTTITCKQIASGTLSESIIKFYLFIFTVFSTFRCSLFVCTCLHVLYFACNGRPHCH
jgi:hypothetical protein